MPIFWRVFLTNLVCVLGGALLATELTNRLLPRGTFTTALHMVMIAVALAISALAIWLGIRHAFKPLRELRGAIDAFRAGNPNARAQVSSSGDPDTREVALAVNQLWDQLQTANAIVAEQNQKLRALAAQVIAAQEEERRRIARELHDEAGQALTTLIIGLERGEQSMAGPQLTHARTMVRQLRDLATQTLDEIRNLALDLRPSLLDDLGLAAALRWYARTCSGRANLPIEVDVHGIDDEERFPIDIETTVFRIVQEGITNVLRHARATRVWVELTVEGDVLTARVTDDGVGIVHPEVDLEERPGRLGLFGMNERARLVGGDLSVRPRDNGGTVVTLRVPLPENAPVREEALATTPDRPPPVPISVGLERR